MMKENNDAIISAATALKMSNDAAHSYADRIVAELIPTINKKIEKSCSEAQFFITVDISKYRDVEIIAQKATAILKNVGYKVKLVDDDYRGYYLYISWA